VSSQDSQHDSGPPPGTVPYGSSQPSGVATPWKAGKEGKTVFRRGTPFVLWWAWVAFAVFNIVDVVIRDHDYFAAELLAGLLTFTGVAYACAFRPRVVADADGVMVYNPYQDHRVGWGGLSGVFLGDSVELTCVRTAPKKDKTVYCWALYSGRRSRKRSQMRQQMRGSIFSPRTSYNPGRNVSSRAPSEVRDLSRIDAVQLMAAELGKRSTDAKGRGAPDSVLESRWAWLPLVLTILPAIALISLWIAR